MKQCWTTSDFIEKSQIVYKNRFDYSCSNYLGFYETINVICKKHGMFETKPQLHLTGKSYCKSCKMEEQDEKWINKCVNKHNGFYSYKQIIKETALSRNHTLILICPIHGEFSMNLVGHIEGRGCKKCGDIKQGKTKLMSFEKFVAKSNSKHNDKYKYFADLWEKEYCNCYSKITIECPIHGLFKQTSDTHIGGAGCYDCGRDKIWDDRRPTTKEFIERSKSIHKGKYDYSATHYVSAKSELIVICPHHGEFSQIAEVHLRGMGCSKCVSRVSKPEFAWLNSLGLPDDASHRQVKILGKKVDGFDPKTNTIYEFYGDYWHGNPNKFKPEDINKVVKKSFKELYEKTLNRETVLKSYGYKIVSIWENEFKK
jgi:hypothetical protein